MHTEHESGARARALSSQQQQRVRSANTACTTNRTTPMVKNHMWGHIGAAKHGSGEHLRDEVDSKRPRLDEGSTSAAANASPPETLVGFATLVTDERVDLTDREPLDSEELATFSRALMHDACCIKTLDMRFMAFGPEGVSVTSRKTRDSA